MSDIFDGVALFNNAGICFRNHSEHASFPSSDREQAVTQSSSEPAALRIDHLDTEVSNEAMSRVLTPFGPLKNCYISFGADGSTKTAFVEVRSGGR